MKVITVLDAFSSSLGDLPEMMEMAPSFARILAIASPIP